MNCTYVVSVRKDERVSTILNMCKHGPLTFGLRRKYISNLYSLILNNNKEISKFAEQKWAHKE